MPMRIMPVCNRPHHIAGKGLEYWNMGKWLEGPIAGAARTSRMHETKQCHAMNKHTHTRALRVWRPLCGSVEFFSSVRREEVDSRRLH